jgi:bifunctional non-homologous end joining protein LigD
VKADLTQYKSSWYFCDLQVGGTSDKEYFLQVEKAGNLFVVNFQFGRRGGPYQTGTKTKEPVPLEDAIVVYNKMVRERQSKGYTQSVTTDTPMQAIVQVTAGTPKNRTPYMAELPEEISQEEADNLLRNERFLLQRKEDGQHMEAAKLTKDGPVVGYNKKGEEKPLPKAIAEALEPLGDTFHFDGEVVKDKYILFDIFELDGLVVTQEEYGYRLTVCRTAEGASPHIKVVETWSGTKEKTAAMALLKQCRAEGVVFKDKRAKWHAGESGQHKKFKFVKMATCKVTALGHKGKENATLALLKDGKWVEVGRASMIGKDKRIAVGSLVEVCFLYATEGGRLYQPRIKELRDDVAEADCTFERQLKHAWKETVLVA